MAIALVRETWPMFRMEQANKTQSDFWNGETAKNWIELDDFQGRSFEGVTAALLERSGIIGQHRVLDIGCGTGDTALPIARSPGAKVVGVDISTVMLDRAHQRLGQEPGLDISYFLGDAQTHAFESATFDRIVSRFGMMFFADPVAAFKNLRAALKPDGEMHFICWGLPKMNPWFGVPRRVAVAHFGELAPAERRSPGPFGFAEKDWVLQLMKDAGLKDGNVDVVDIDLTPCETTEELRPLAGLGPIASAMREKEGRPEDRAAMTEAFLSEMSQYLTPDGVRIPAQLNLFSATK